MVINFNLKFFFLNFNRYLKLLFPKKFFLKKYLNLIKFYFFRNKKKLALNYLPYSMDIEPTTGCNFRCTMCQVSSPHFKAQNMSMSTFRTIIDQNHQLFKIKLQGMGEPTVNKFFLNMIEYANFNGISVDFTTNGSLLNEDFVKKLTKLNISRIIISIDGATKKTFEKIRVKSDFAKVIDNSIMLINAFKNYKFRPIISAWTVVQKDNFEELIDIYNLANQIKFDELSYQFHISNWGKKEWSQSNKEKQMLSSINDFKNLIDNLNKKNKNLIAKIFDENFLNFNNQCSWPWNSTYIDNQGNVVPCCIIGDHKVKSFGNIKNEDFKEIYNNSDYQAFRFSIKENSLPDFCKNCYKEFNKK